MSQLHPTEHSDRIICIPKEIRVFGTSILSPLTEFFQLLPQHFRPENKTVRAAHMSINAPGLASRAHFQDIKGHHH